MPLANAEELSETDLCSHLQLSLNCLMMLLIFSKR